MLHSRPIVRVAVVLVAWALVACEHADRTLGLEGGDDQSGNPNGALPGGCRADSDCATAAATCCDCPAFAVSVDDPAHRACTGVTCPSPSACPDNVRAACDQGQCVLACVAMACPTACAGGYQVDATGCASCACAAPVGDGCTTDRDCVQTRADCCGCDQGGADTAVLARDRAAFDASLGCPAQPACPSVDVCAPGAAPMCIQGRCELVAGDLPAGACGRPDLPACPGGTVCTVNTSDLANQYGVGVCVPL